jgi:hypothetical protein
MKKVSAVFAVVLITVFANVTAKAAEISGESVAADIAKQLLEGWTCNLITEKGKMGYPQGLQEPLFRLDFVNTNIVLHEKLGPLEPVDLHPNLRLHFHSKTEREEILKVMDSERVSSADISTIFGETKDFVIVSSPAWRNAVIIKEPSGVMVASSTEEANKAIDPLLQALGKYVEAHK